MVKISELFEVKRGTCGNLDNYASGETLLVTATTYNHAAGGFVTAKENDRLFAPMSVAVAIDGDGSVMFGSVQRTEFVASTHVEVLTPKAAVFWESLLLEKLIAIAGMLRTQRWRFGFGRSAAGRLKDLELDEALIERIASQVKIARPAPVALEAGVLHQVVAKLRELYGENPTVGEVFELKQGTAASVAALSESGNIPVVSATEKAVNAVAGYLTECEGARMPPGCISVAKNGKPGVARLQQQPWALTTDVACLNPRTAFEVPELLVLSALIERQCWRFGYGRKASEGRLARIRLLDGLAATQ